MYSYSKSYSNSSSMNQYLVQEVLDATPQQLLFKVYDFAIVQCQKRDIGKTNKALQELINALKFEGDENARDMSIGLLRLYQYCQEQMRKNNYDIVHRILTELRDQWKSILQLGK